MLDYVMPYGRHWGAPFMLAALAGVIHDCQRADGQEHNRSDHNCYGGLHRHLPTANLPPSFLAENEPTLNVRRAELAI